eukprot:GHRR01030169.1.p1 GENE.GHRR01030169.1~~GHRR01030169.1.p1  ORF type:complete len:211 (+),score=59.76 GHRR01030169.1:254-886(+)
MLQQGVDMLRAASGSRPVWFSTQCPKLVTVTPSRSCRVIAQAHANQDGISRRVVVTGMGLVSPLGHEVDEFYNNLLEGRSGVTEISTFDTSGFTTRFAGEIKSLECEGYIAKKLERRLDKTIKYVLVSGKKALADAGLDWQGDSIKDLDKARCGILIGSAFGGMQCFTTAVEALETQSKWSLLGAVSASTCVGAIISSSAMQFSSTALVE